MTVNYKHAVGLLEEVRRRIETEAFYAHKRCPDGSHWDPEEHKCIELTGYDAQIHNAANAATEVAFHPATKKKSPEDRVAAIMHAANIHDFAAKHFASGDTDDVSSQHYRQWSNLRGAAHRLMKKYKLS